MPIVDNRTPHLSLALPYIDNLLEDDNARLVETLNAIDSKFQALDLLLASDDINLDQLQELVNAIKANQGDVTNLLAIKADVTYVDTQDAALQAGIDAINQSTPIADHAYWGYFYSQIG